MKIWIIIALAVFSSCNGAQNEDSPASLHDGWDDYTYEDNWSDRNVDGMLRKIFGEEEKEGDFTDSDSNEESIQEVPIDNKDIISKTIIQSNEDQSIVIGDKIVVKDIKNLLSEDKNEMTFKDYQFEDNRSGNREEKSQEKNSGNEDSDSDYESAEEDQDNQNVETVLEPDYDLDKEEVENEKSKEQITEELHDALLHLSDDEISKLVHDTRQVSPQDAQPILNIESHNAEVSAVEEDGPFYRPEHHHISNAVFRTTKQIDEQNKDSDKNDSANEENSPSLHLNPKHLRESQETGNILEDQDDPKKTQNTDSDDEEDVPLFSSVDNPIEKFAENTKQLLAEPEDTLHQNSQEESSKFSEQDSHNNENRESYEDTDINVSEVNYDDADHGFADKSSDEETSINEEDLKNILKDNEGLAENLGTLFKEIDDMEMEGDSENERIPEVDFEQLFDDGNNNDTNVEVFQIIDDGDQDKKENAENKKESSKKIVTTQKLDSNETSTSLQIDAEDTITKIELDSLNSQLDSEFGETINTDLDKLNEASSDDDTKITRVKVDDLTDTEFQELMRQFVDLHGVDLDLKSEAVAPIHIELTAYDVVTVTSPDYPNPYPTNNIVDWVFEGKGSGFELNITDFDVSGVAGDYLLIKPGGMDESANGIIVTHHLATERRYRFTNVDKLLVRFESKPSMFSKKGFSFNVKMLFGPAEEEEDIATELPLLPTPLYTLTVTLGGMSLPQFLEIQEDFRLLVVDMATLYVNQYMIDVENTTSSVTQIISTSLCNLNWPEAEKCVQVEFAVPVVQEEGFERLNEDDLHDMWFAYVYQDPFAARLRQMGVTSFSVPRTAAVISVWLVVGIGVMVSMSVLAFVLWRYSCVENYTRMQNASEASSVTNEKRPLDLYPTPHQTLPPLYSDPYKYKYEDTATVDMDGFNNQGYMQDDLFDLESDEEVNKRERKSGHGITARDIYKV